MADLYYQSGRGPRDTAVRAHLASGALPLVGVGYSAQAFSFFPPGIGLITFIVSYQNAAGAGQPRFRLEWQDLLGNTVKGSLLDATVVTAASPYGRISSYQIEINGPAVVDANATLYEYSFKVPGGMRAARLLATELTANAGTCAITVAGTGLGGE